MTRSFGDQVAHEIGVISTPEISVRKITSESYLLMLASDGLLEVVEKRNMTESLRDCMQRKKSEEMMGGLMKLAIEA